MVSNEDLAKALRRLLSATLAMQWKHILGIFEGLPNLEFNIQKFSNIRNVLVRKHPNKTCLIILRFCQKPCRIGLKTTLGFLGRV